MALHSDPTANQAIGQAQKEWVEMAVLAIRIRRSSDRKWAENQEERFTGIYRRLLTDPEKEILDELPEKAKRRCQV